MKELKVGIDAAKTAAKIIQKYYGRHISIQHKGEINLVTEVDVLAQKMIVKIIHKTFKNDAILAEESGLSKTADAPRRWIVDPIDGTTNFAHGYPKYCVSIAFEEAGELRCGVIYDPTLNELFHSVKGKGAFLNKKRLHVSNPKNLRQSLLVTGFAYDLEKPEYNNIPLFIHMLKKAQAIRRDGSAALDLAYVAAGRFDGFWELGVNPWDTAAGILLIEEAGGKVAHMSGRKAKVTDYAIATSGPGIFPDLLSELQSVWVNTEAKSA